ncbi:MAG: hypothetical protein ABS46_12900 [Cytophagaceae bacterium SCN 52-12]|nr:MAG: hypothetical protein ABS46_12900 [Cytophagaceae bacterium SCN 52-12]
MTQHEFDRLTEKYLAGQCSDEEIALLEKWATLHYDEQSTGRLFDSDKAEQETREKIWQLLKTGSLSGKRIIPVKWIAGIAASLLLLGAGLQYLRQMDRHSEKQVTEVVSDTTSGHPSRITLPDGSSVILGEGADIVADESFGAENRKVWLDGEAFFEVMPDPQKPFIVQTGDLVTEVLGTSFRIKPQQSQKKIEVSVVSGKVSVYTAESTGKNKKDGVIAMPNQKVSYDLILKTLRQDLVDAPQPVQKAESHARFLFDEVPVGQVLDRISEIYGVQLIAGNPDMRQCIFTGDLTGLDMYRQLDFLCEVTRARYEIRGTAIFISGPGCQAAQR